MLRFWKGIEQKMFFKYSSSGKFSNKIKENNNKNDKNKKKKKKFKVTLLFNWIKGYYFDVSKTFSLFLCLSQQRSFSLTSD